MYRNNRLNKEYKIFKYEVKNFQIVDLIYIIDEAMRSNNIISQSSKRLIILSNGIIKSSINYDKGFLFNLDLEMKAIKIFNCYNILRDMIRDKRLIDISDKEIYEEILEYENIVIQLNNILRYKYGLYQDKVSKYLI